jgi:TonB-dependent receptor
MHSRLEETKKNIGVNAEYAFTLYNKEQKLKAGVHHSERTADYEQIYIHAGRNTAKPIDITSLVEFYDPANFESGAMSYHVVSFSNRPVDYYKGNQTIDAFYLMGEITPIAPLKIVGGARFEDAKTSVETVVTNFYDGDDVFNGEHTTTRPEKEWLPSITAIYSFTPALNFRAAYSENLVRADFRELTNGQYYDVANRMNVVSNKPLEQTNIKNYDLRLEWYPAYGEVVSLSAFYKEFDNPVEKVLIPLNDTKFYTSTINLDRSTMRGLELNFRKSFHFISSDLDDLWLSGNFALVDGTVEAKSDIWKIEPRNRTLQGLAPYNLNASLMYEGDRLGASASYTRAGRVLIYGGAEAHLDQYENPRNVLDLQVYARFLNKRLEVKFNASDILNEDIIVYSNSFYVDDESHTVKIGPNDNTALGLDYNDGDHVFSRIGKGVNLSLSATYKI